MAKKMDPGYKYRAAGAIVMLAGFILAAIGVNLNINYLVILFMPLLFAGLIVISYGFTRVEIKGDKSYQKHLRRTSKVSMILLPIFILLLFLGGVAFVLNSFYIAIALFAVACVIILWFIINFYRTVYKTAKHLARKTK